MKSIFNRLRQPRAIRIEFQPIVTVFPDRIEAYAVEALARGPRGSSVERPEVLFEYARRKGVESAVDIVCIAEAFAGYTHIPARPLLSINIHYSTLACVDNFPDRLLQSAATHGITPDRLMLEVLEYHAPGPLERFISTLDELREAGVRIAIDDIGSGASNYQRIVECRPDHLKIDRHLITGCAGDRWRRAALESIATLGLSCGAVAIAEGVEDIGDLQTLLDLGIRTVQGWLFGRAVPAQELALSPLFATQPMQLMKGRNR